MEKILKKIKTNAVLSSLLCVVLGIVLVIWPDMSMQVVCIAIGIVLLLTGLMKIGEYLIAKDASLYAQMSLVFGIVLAVVGVWIIMKPSQVLAIIPIIVGIVIVLHGVHNLQQTVTLCKGQYDKWWVALLLGLLTVGLGVLLICKPFTALDTVVMLIGGFLIYDGVSNIWIVSRVYKSAKILKQEAEAVDVDAKEV